MFVSSLLRESLAPSRVSLPPHTWDPVRNRKSRCVRESRFHRYDFPATCGSVWGHWLPGRTCGQSTASGTPVQSESGHQKSRQPKGSGFGSCRSVVLIIGDTFCRHRWRSHAFYFQSALSRLLRASLNMQKVCMVTAHENLHIIAIENVQRRGTKP